MSLDIDLSPFFDQLNAYLPAFLGLFAVIGAIGGAIALSKMIIGAVVNAFSGRGID
jgi:hypothetical protein